MNNGFNKEKQRHIRLLIISLLIALVCFGICAYLVVNFRGTEQADQTIVNISKIVVLIGIFFLVIAFGHIVPAFFSLKKSENGVQEANPNDMFNEATMRQALEKYIPDGETMLAGIHAVTKESSVTCTFGNCILTEDTLLADVDGNTISISKTKYSTYDMYLAITQHSLVVADCQPNRYYYEFDKEPITNETKIQTVTEDILLKDVGKCFPLTDIESCEMKNGLVGSINCMIKLKNGGYFKLLLPKQAGLGGGMPHHEEYRNAIIECLSQYQV